MTFDLVAGRHVHVRRLLKLLECIAIDVALSSAMCSSCADDSDCCRPRVRHGEMASHGILCSCAEELTCKSEACLWANRCGSVRRLPPVRAIPRGIVRGACGRSLDVVRVAAVHPHNHDPHAGTSVAGFDSMQRMLFMLGLVVWGKRAPRQERGTEVGQWLEQLRTLRAQLNVVRSMIDAVRDPGRQQQLRDAYPAGRGAPGSIRRQWTLFRVRRQQRTPGCGTATHRGTLSIDHQRSISVSGRTIHDRCGSAAARPRAHGCTFRSWICPTIFVQAVRETRLADRHVEPTREVVTT